ncbi:hypothetical protein RxyAA322_04350 [Rubrobacter xylanophilus]|uniref:Uncharacterized protein n=1 Tax=Rubrobacter xylanophilus TaxID=49319 RepID=A0A510HF53_9ACTN|nr:hypothetical protein [Rubrobacter xylanophilus]BBL78581.1 hypothetical protein RxyAA322_04350 [Rubrobacter xylanophilus]
MDKTKLAVKLLQNRHARHLALRALRNEKVRKVLLKQVAKRLFR